MGYVKVISSVGEKPVNHVGGFSAVVIRACGYGGTLDPKFGDSVY
jgi:hypothetical protein